MMMSEKILKGKKKTLSFYSNALHFRDYVNIQVFFFLLLACSGEKMRVRRTVKTYKSEFSKRKIFK